MIDFIIQHPQIAKAWHEQSNYLCQLSVENEDELYKLLEKAREKGIKCTPFFEPDIENQLTAICLEPSPEARKLTSRLPLMLRELEQKALKEAA